MNIIHFSSTIITILRCNNIIILQNSLPNSYLFYILYNKINNVNFVICNYIITLMIIHSGQEGSSDIITSQLDCTFVDAVVSFAAFQYAELHYKVECGT